MKGHSKIELTDVNTGKKEVHENDNMVTNALKYFLADLGILGGSPVAYSSTVRNNAAWKTLLGGILLFGDTLAEDAENVLPPSGITMIGNGSYNVSNSGNVTELGSCNVTESGVQSDGSVKIVWDFSTAQANGTIKSCALTSSVGGYMGVGNATSGICLSGGNSNVLSDSISSWSDSFSRSKPNINPPVAEAGNYEGGANYLCYCDLGDNTMTFVEPNSLRYSKDYASEHFSSTGNIVIKKFFINGNKLNLKCVGSTPSIVKEEHSIHVPEEIMAYLGNAKTYNYYRLLCNEDNIYIFLSNKQELETNDSFYCLKIDNAFNVTTYKMYNTLSSFIYIDETAYYSYTYAVTKKGFLCVSSGSEQHNYAIKIDDSSIVRDLGFVGVPHAYNIAVYDERVEYYYDGRYVIDVEAQKRYKLNYANNDFNGCATSVIGNQLAYVHRKNYNGSNNIYGERFANYLGTINNLSEPVTKTSAQTMKITYTLTFD